MWVIDPVGLFSEIRFISDVPKGNLRTSQGLLAPLHHRHCLCHHVRAPAEAVGGLRLAHGLSFRFRSEPCFPQASAGGKSVQLCGAFPAGILGWGEPVTWACSPTDRVTGVPDPFIPWLAGGELRMESGRVLTHSQLPTSQPVRGPPSRHRGQAGQQPGRYFGISHHVCISRICGVRRV